MILMNFVICGDFNILFAVVKKNDFLIRKMYFYIFVMIFSLLKKKVNVLYHENSFVMMLMILVMMFHDF